jgi:hypothetical protein
VTDDYATRRELDQLRQELIRMDDHGTRGVSVVQTQLTDVIKDMLELKGEMSKRFAEHQRLHEREEDQRSSNRKWALGFAVAVLGMLGGLYPFVAHLHR